MVDERTPSRYPSCGVSPFVVVPQSVCPRAIDQRCSLPKRGRFPSRDMDCLLLLLFERRPSHDSATMATTTFPRGAAQALATLTRPKPGKLIHLLDLLRLFLIPIIVFFWRMLAERCVDITQESSCCRCTTCPTIVYRQTSSSTPYVCQLPLLLSSFVCFSGSPANSLCSIIGPCPLCPRL